MKCNIILYLIGLIIKQNVLGRNRSNGGNSSNGTNPAKPKMVSLSLISNWSSNWCHHVSDDHNCHNNPHNSCNCDNDHPHRHENNNDHPHHHDNDNEPSRRTCDWDLTRVVQTVRRERRLSGGICIIVMRWDWDGIENDCNNCAQTVRFRKCLSVGKK